MAATKAARDFAATVLHTQPDTDPALLEELTQQIEQALQTGEIPLADLERTARDLTRPPDSHHQQDLLSQITLPLRKPPF
jgi:hypothetical protein